MMENRPQEQPISADIVIMDYIRFLPEEKRKDYEVMLRRCNFHDSDDPLFPIMLFLLFFQESVSYNVDRIDDSISEMKCVLQKSGQDKFARYGAWISKFVLIALTIVNLLTFCMVLSSPAGKTVKATVRTAQNELQAIHNYWTKKLEEDPVPLQSHSFDGGWTFALFAVILAAAWIPSVWVLLHLKRINFPKKSENQTGQKHHLFWCNPPNKKKHKFKQKKRKKRSPAPKQETNTEQNKEPEKEQNPAPKQETSSEQNKAPEKEQSPAPKQETSSEQNKTPEKEQSPSSKQESSEGQNKEPEKEQSSALKQDAHTEQNKEPEKEQSPSSKQESSTGKDEDPGEKKNSQQTDNSSAEPKRRTKQKSKFKRKKKK